MIKAQGIIKTFEGSQEAVLKGVDLSLNDGDFISLMGRSGSGKSTLLYLLSTLDRNFEGSVFYDGVSIKEMGVQEIHRLRNEQIGFVFQFHYLLSELSAIENILLPARKANLLDKKLSFARDLLEQIGLSDKADRLPHHLSGGEQQRITIARALIMQPKYLFADEPTGNLDSKNGEIIFDLFSQFNKEYKTTIIYVTHDQQFGMKAHRRILINDGIIDKIS